MLKEFKDWYQTHWIDLEDCRRDEDLKKIQEEAFNAGYMKRQDQERELHGRRKEDRK